MIIPQQLLLPQQTIAKLGAVRALVQTASLFGSRGVLVHGRSLVKSGKLAEILGASKQVRTWEHGGGEPTVEGVDALRAELKRDRPDWVAAVGGGSVIDLAKAAAGLVGAPETTAFYQRNPGAIPPATLPLIAAPATAGTGSEATVVSVLTNPAECFKQSIRHPTFMPKIVLLDPELLAGCPKETIAAAGLDAFIQAFESYTSKYATPFTRALSELALVRISQALLPLYQGDMSFAGEMLEASYITGLAFSHARLGVIHGLAHPLGARFNAAHGLTCACCLSAALAFNRTVIAQDVAYLKMRYNLDIEAHVQEWLSEMALENPFAGKHVSDLDTFVSEVLASGSTAANPRTVTAEDARQLLAEITLNV
ncbi:MAG: iron-containing alcohol dehydrogenase [bacterium]